MKHNQDMHNGFNRFGHKGDSNARKEKVPQGMEVDRNKGSLAE